MTYPRLAFIDGSEDPWLYATPHSPHAKQHKRKSTTKHPFELIPGVSWRYLTCTYLYCDDSSHCDPAGCPPLGRERRSKGTKGAQEYRQCPCDRSQIRQGLGRRMGEPRSMENRTLERVISEDVRQSCARKIGMTIRFARSHMRE